MTREQEREELERPSSQEVRTSEIYLGFLAFLVLNGGVMIVREGVEGSRDIVIPGKGTLPSCIKVVTFDIREGISSTQR